MQKWWDLSYFSPSSSLSYPFVSVVRTPVCPFRCVSVTSWTADTPDPPSRTPVISAKGPRGSASARTSSFTALPSSLSRFWHHTTAFQQKEESLVGRPARVSIAWGALQPWLLLLLLLLLSRFSRVGLCDPIDGSPPGSPIPGFLQTRTLEWVAISLSNA